MFSSQFGDDLKNTKKEVRENFTLTSETGKFEDIRFDHTYITAHISLGIHAENFISTRSVFFEHERFL